MPKSNDMKKMPPKMKEAIQKASMKKKGGGKRMFGKKGKKGY